MFSTHDMQVAASSLRTLLENVDQHPNIKKIIESRDSVLAHYQPMFSFDRISEISEADFRGFLRFENNHHWTGLHRCGNALCKDMSRVRDALRILLDESQPIINRLERLVPKAGPSFMKYFGKALITAILLVAHPDKYGVYNGTSEDGMTAVGVLPKFDKGLSVARRYQKINRILLDLASDLHIDLWR
ncbi:MAG: hypothetical protein JW959_10680 [Pirellulales bacterium]|nr:hypothetical protein [Pirellulales bacterium]